MPNAAGVHQFEGVGLLLGEPERLECIRRESRTQTDENFNDGIEVDVPSEPGVGPLAE